VREVRATVQVQANGFGSPVQARKTLLAQARLLGKASFLGLYQTDSLTWQGGTVMSKATKHPLVLIPIPVSTRLEHRWQFKLA
jgi:hypothetical protein